jgi:peptidyl-prolyl cis-trans isomerase A (cyclophilin A)
MFRYIALLPLVFLIVLTGCRSRSHVELLRPGEIDVWRNQRSMDAPATVAVERPRVLLSTTHGDVVVELFDDQSPISTENFLRYVDSGFYNGTLFHRVIPGFMIQGGGFTPPMNEKAAQDPIRNEAGNGLRNMRGTLAMARTNQVDSATAQFFINLVDNHFLNGDGVVDGYAVFGRVVEGMEVVDAIARVDTRELGPHRDVPVDSVIILLARRSN